ncbi:hypothetical protein PCASD_26128, partial [Puccinia coronata f. sp. avenae]
MKKGEWLLVENSNLCSASVLDRLNPLFEGAGRRQLAEKGMTNRGIDTVTPHDDFRIVFAFNPWYGKLSHAMRNRGVEALIHSPTAYPLLSRTLDRYLPSSSPDHTLKLLLDRLLQSDIQSVMHLLDQNRSLCHQFVIRLVIAACLPLRLLSHRSHLKSNGSKTMTSESLVKLSHHIDPAHLSTYVNHASDSVLQACLLVSSEAQESLIRRNSPDYSEHELMSLKPIHSRGSWKVRHWIALSDGEDCSPDWQDFVATMALLLINSGILVNTERSAGNAVKAHGLTRFRGPSVS